MGICIFPRARTGRARPGCLVAFCATEPALSAAEGVGTLISASCQGVTRMFHFRPSRLCFVSGHGFSHAETNPHTPCHSERSISRTRNA